MVKTEPSTINSDPLYVDYATAAISAKPKAITASPLSIDTT
jgi:hypothetical protein